MKQQIFKRSKRTTPNEQDALNNVCELQKTTADKLQAEHTDTHFIWKTIAAEQSNQDGKGTFAKQNYTEKEAIDSAMAELDTFEGNLKPDHTETHYVFSKVRE